MCNAKFRGYGRAYGIVVCALICSVLACNLSEAATPQPTFAPASVIQSPVVGLNPVSGPPGTVIRVSAAGFPAGSKVNLYLSPLDGTSPNPIAQDLTIGTGGILSFAMQMPTQVGGTTLSGITPLTFTISTTDNTIRANAVFVATASGTPTATTSSAASGDTETTGGGSATQLFITSPAIGATIAGSTVVVTGSGRAFNNRVGVQVVNNRQDVLGSAFATIQAASGAIGPWETTITFAQPAAATSGYIVVYTVNAQGIVAEQASIPIALAGAGVGTPTKAPTVVITTAPTVPAVITVGPTAGPTATIAGAPTTGGATTPSFITATPR